MLIPTGPLVACVSLLSTVAVFAPSNTCERLACGTFTGVARQVDELDRAQYVDEVIEITEPAANVARVNERTVNRTTKAAMDTTWEFTFTGDTSFTISILGRGDDARVAGQGQCVHRQCTFAFDPSEGLASGTLAFTDRTVNFVIQQMDGDTGNHVVRAGHLVKRP